MALVNGTKAHLNQRNPSSSNQTTLKRTPMVFAAKSELWDVSLRC